MMPKPNFNKRKFQPAKTLHPPITNAAQSPRLHHNPLGSNRLASLQITHVLAEELVLLWRRILGRGVYACGSYKPNANPRNDPRYPADGTAVTLLFASNMYRVYIALNQNTITA